MKQIFPEKEYQGLRPNFHIHLVASDLHIPTMELPFLLEEICGPLLGIYKSLTDKWNEEIGAEAALFLEKEYINGIASAVRYHVIIVQNHRRLPVGIFNVKMATSGL